jgi:hypothetical protein
MIDMPPAIVEVLTDHGGTLGEREAVIDWFKRNGISVHITGLCGSACTLFLSLPKDQLCIGPDAWIGFHTHPGSDDDMIEWRRGRDFIARGFRECRR